MPRRQQPMTVGELIEQLQDFDPNMPVKFSYDYGDHWHTEVAPNIQNVETRKIKYSGYHSMYMIDKSEDEDDNEENESNENECVIIS